MPEARPSNQLRAAVGRVLGAAAGPSNCSAVGMPLQSQRRREKSRERPASAASLWHHASLHTPAALRARAALRHHRKVLDALDLWWATAVNSMRAAGRKEGAVNNVRAEEGAVVLAICEEEYIQVSKKIYKAMIQPYDEAEAEANARCEWRDDTRGASALPCEGFKDALFELADLWTAGIDAVEYAVFLLQLFHRIAEGAPPDAFLWLPTEQIVHGGYTSPRKLRADEPASRPPPLNHVAVDVLRLDDNNQVAEETHTVEERPPAVVTEDDDQEGGQLRPSQRSPLRGGRCAESESDVLLAELGLSERRRPTSSPMRRNQLLTASSSTLPGSNEQRHGARPPSAPVPPPSAPPKLRDEARAPRWHGTKRHRPRSSSTASAASRSSLSEVLDDEPLSRSADQLRPPTRAGMTAAGPGDFGVAVLDGDADALLRPAMGVQQRSTVPTMRGARSTFGATVVTSTLLRLAVEPATASGVPAKPLPRQPLGVARPNVSAAARRVQKSREVTVAMRTPDFFRAAPTLPPILTAAGPNMTARRPVW